MTVSSASLPAFTDLRRKPDAFLTIGRRCVATLTAKFSPIDEVSHRMYPARFISQRHAESRYQRGPRDLLPLPDSQRARLTVPVSANGNQTQTQLDSVRLFKAPGGARQTLEPAATEAVGTAVSQTTISTNEESS